MSVHNLRTERMQPGDVYVGRRSRQSMAHVPRDADGADGYFGNPFRLGQDENRERIVRRFEEHARERLATDPEYRARVKALHGKRLFCWCAPLACHGDVLERLARELVEADLSAGEGGS